MSRAAVKPGDLLAEAARLGVSIRPGSAPGRVKLTGPSEAVRRMLPLVARHKAELLEVLTGRQAAPEPAPDPRQSWSHYTPATADEIMRMLERTEMFERMGLAPDEVDLAVDRLHLRDREGDDRHLCLECQHVRADATNWRCGALRGPIPREWVATQLQRCPSFLQLAPATNLQPR
jgi:hypothetical protein